MHKTKEQPVNHVVHFFLSNSKLEEPEKLNRIGFIDYLFERSLILKTDFPLEPGQVLHFNEKIKEYQVGVVEAVLNYGKTCTD